MKSRYGKFSAIPVCILAVILLQSCAQTQPSRFYILDADLKQTENKSDSDAVTVGLHPVRISEYLDRPQLVFRIDSNQIILSEFDRWAEPLEQSITRVLDANLSSLLSESRVAAFPWGQDVKPAAEIRVMVARFEGSPGEDVLLRAEWSIKMPDSPRVHKYSVLRADIEVEGVNAMVSEMSNLLGLLSEEMVKELKALPGTW